jgi:hypothetical protein
MQVICHSHSARESGIYAWKCGEYMRNIGGHLRNAIEKRNGMRSCLIAMSARFRWATDRALKALTQTICKCCRCLGADPP